MPRFLPHYGQKGTLEEIQAQIANIHRYLVGLGDDPKNAAQQDQGVGLGGTANAVAGVAGGTTTATGKVPENQVVFDPDTGHDHSAGVATAVPLTGDVTGTNQAATVIQAALDFLVGRYLNVTAAVPATTDRGLISIGAGGFAGGGAPNFAGGGNGTALAINLPVGSVARLLDLQVGGVSKIIVGAGGVITVPTALAAGGLELATATKTGAYTATVSDYFLFGDATGGAFTITLPAAASSTRFTYVIAKIDSSANAVTVKANGAELINGANTKVLAAQYDVVRVVCNGSQWYIW